MKRRRIAAHNLHIFKFEPETLPEYRVVFLGADGREQKTNPQSAHNTLGAVNRLPDDCAIVRVETRLPGHTTWEPVK